MLEIMSGSLEALKSEMLAKQKQKKEEISALKKQVRQLAKEKAATQDRLKLGMKIEDLERLVALYNPAHVLPVSVGKSVINYLGLSKFMKKVEKLNPVLSVTDHGVCLNYTVNGYKGSLILSDLVEDFWDITHIPVAEIRNDEA